MPILSAVAAATARGYGFTLSPGDLFPTVIGEAYGGGFYAGQISTTANGIATHYLVVAPISSGQASRAWKNANTTTSGTSSSIDGPGNTASMVADGNSTVYPAAHFCNDAVIGGFSDWYMPARNELEICYFNLKPTTTNNNTSSGINSNAVPARATNYTTGNPAQTSAAAFQSGGAEAFTASSYWSSTQSGATTGWNQYFSTGLSFGNLTKTYAIPVRAVRRVSV
jgi:hypothetical protein